MIKVCLIGYGKWGKILFKKLKNITRVVKILNSSNYNIKNLMDADWVVIATPNKSHYGIIKSCIKIKKNIFCEKPLVLKLHQAKELYKLAKINRVKIVVSDLSDYKKRVKILKKDNNFIRCKKSNYNPNQKFNKYDSLYKFAYHDIGYLYKFIKDKGIKSINVISSKNILNFSIKFGNTNFTFYYDANNKNKIYKFNNISLLQKKDIIQKMFIDYLIKNKSITQNKKKSLFVIKTLELIRGRF